MASATTTRTATACVTNWKSQAVPTLKLPTTHHLPQTTTAHASSRSADVHCHLPATLIQPQTSTCQVHVTSLACLACLRAMATAQTSWLATTVQMSLAFTSMERATCALRWAAPTRMPATSIQTPKSAERVTSIRARCLDAPMPMRATTMQMRIRRMALATTTHVSDAWTTKRQTSIQTQRWTAVSARLTCQVAHS